MVDPVTLAVVAGGIKLGSSLLGNGKRKKAARQRAAANLIQRKQAAISNELGRRRAISQQRAAAANAKASAAALGVLGSASSNAAGSAASSLSAGIARQKQKEAADVRTSQLDQSASKNDSRAQFVEGLGSTAASIVSAIPTG